MYSKARHVWIHYEPGGSRSWMGFLSLGSSVKLKNQSPRPGDDCEKYYAIEPRGWICLNSRVTLDPQDPAYLAVRYFSPNIGRPFPHNYGESRGAPRYFHIPTRQEQHKREYKLDEHLEHLKKWRAGAYEKGQEPSDVRGVDPTPAGHGPPAQWSQIPKNVQEHRDYLKPMSTVAWSRQFDAEGRTWLVTADLALIPKDKVTPYPRSRFQGLHLTKKTRLPIAFVRGHDVPKYDQAAQATGKVWPRLSRIPIEDGTPIQRDGRSFYRLADRTGFVDVDDVTVARLAAYTPWGSTIVSGGKSYDGKVALKRVPEPLGGRKTWVEVSVLGGWMVAYEDKKPVYATLIAPGRGGIPRRGVDPLKTASTPTGIFRVDGKFYTATMANNAFVHSDVPYSQNFHGPHVLHQAYWHNTWGEKTSGGCVNIAPLDAPWFFEWTEPPMPAGWFGMRSDRLAGPATVVWVHR